jgi:hypothetical protein
VSAAFVWGSHDRWRNAKIPYWRCDGTANKVSLKWHFLAVQPRGDDGFSVVTDKRAAALVTEADLHGSGRKASSFGRTFSTSGALGSSFGASDRRLRAKHPFARSAPFAVR